MRTLSTLAAAVAVLACLGCGPPVVKLRPGASCATTVTAGPSVSSVQDALARATPGTCVVAVKGKYAASFTVPAGVSLSGEVGAEVEFNGDSNATAAVTLSAGATLSSAKVLNPPSVGVAIVGPGATMVQVDVEGAPHPGVVLWCEDDCLVADGSEIRETTLSHNAVGLLVHAGRLNVVDSAVSSNQSSSLASGYGVVASDGSVLTMSGTAIEDNEELGLLLDGALGTSATLDTVAVRNNRGRGIWAQGLTGTTAAPKLSLTNCALTGNRLAGLGARASKGIALHGGTVASTVLGQTASDTPGVLVSVGDGIGLFSGTGEVLVDAVALDSNQRSQVLIDQGDTGLVVQGGTVTAQAGQFGVVVQHTTVQVTAPSITTPQAGQELAISAPTVAVPSR